MPPANESALAVLARRFLFEGQPTLRCRSFWLGNAEIRDFNCSGDCASILWRDSSGSAWSNFANEALMSRPRHRPSKVRQPRAPRRWPLRVLLAALTIGAVLVIAPWTALVLAKSAITRREPETALRWLRCAEWFRQHRAEIRFLQARCWRRLGQTEEFRTAIQAAAQAGYPTPRLEREQILLQAQLGRLNEVEDQIPRILQTAEEDTAEACEAYVSGLLLNFRQVEALRVIDSWSKDYPGDLYPVLIQGQVHQNAGKLEEAEAAYRQALAMSPHSRAVQQNLADVLVSAQKIEPALELYRRLTADTQRRDAAWLQIAKCERLRGDLDAAQRALSQIRDRARFTDGSLDLQEGLVALDQQRFEQAALALDRAKRANPRSVEIRHARAQALRGAQRNEDAAKEAEFVATAQAELSRGDQLHDQIVANPLDPRLRLEIGKILLKYGDPVRGVVWVQSALNLRPTYRDANLTLATYYEEQASKSPQSASLARQYRARAADATAETDLR